MPVPRAAAKQAGMAFRVSLPVRYGAALVAALSVTGCGAFDRDLPDAFAVTTHPPLMIPNTFSLPPPRPGAAGAREESPRLQAEAVLVPEVALSGEKGADSPGQRALLQAAGPPAPRNIRRLIDQESQADSGSGIADTLLFWKGSPPPPGAPIDPGQEAARLRERGAKTPAAPAPATARAKAKSGGMLDWLF